MSTEVDLASVPHIQKLLDELSKRKGYKNPRYDLSLGSKTGDNYVGLVYRATIRDGDGDGDQEPLALIFKTMPKSAKRRAEFQSEKLFCNEGRFYDVVVPALTDLLVEKGLVAEGASFPDTAECVMVSVGDGEGEHTIVMRDLREEGYVMHDRRQGLDLDHCLVVVRALARLHAGSMALEHLNPERARVARESVSELLCYEDSPFKSMLENSTKIGFEMMKDRFPEGSAEYARVKRVLNNYFEKISNAVQPDPEGGNCITHGDSWINNFLFRYSEDTGAVESVRLLDFQISRYCSPVSDLSYLLFTCVESEVRAAHLEEIYRAYHRELQGRLRALGCDRPDAIFSWERMQSHLKKYSVYGFGMSLLVIPLFLADTEAVPDLDTEFEDGAGMEDIFTRDTGNKAAVNKRFCDSVRDMIDLGYL